MHKIKKGIKKKIKGKKGKQDELFTAEEYERYKKQKEEEEEAKHKELNTEYEVTDDNTNAEQICADSPTEYDENCIETKEDWRNFLTTTDVVLKKSSKNLEQIKESSYFQVIKKPEEESEAELENNTARTPSPVTVASSHKNWVDLHKGLDEDEEEQLEAPKPESPKKPIELRVRELKEIAPIEAIPSVDVEDYADIFDTTYVDQVESGEVQLYLIPDDPSEDECNDLDLFDTSIVDKVLAPKVSKKKKAKKEGKKKSTKKEVKKDPVKEEPPKKKAVVNLGSAVQALTKGEPVPSVEKTDSKKDPNKEEDINLLFESDSELPLADSSNLTVEKTPAPVDSILFSEEPVADLPEVVCPIQIPVDKTEEKEDDKRDHQLAFDVNEFLDSELTGGEDTQGTKSSNLEILVSELEGKTTQSQKDRITHTVTYKAVDDDIRDEFDAEFAVLAAESIAKEKDKSISELGLIDDDDPFDTSGVIEIIGEQDSEVNQTEPVIEKKPSVGLLDTENVEADPFDTSAVNAILPVDPFDTVEGKVDLPESLQPEATKSTDDLNGIDPFDTSAASSFGKTELKVLETELLNNLVFEVEDELEFDPRAFEESSKDNLSETPKGTCLLTTELEISDAPVLAPQSSQPLEKEVDPFDTSFAEKIHIKSLEAELLSNTSPHNLTPITSKKAPPRPPSPASQQTEQFQKDPFDTSIAETLTDDFAIKQKENSSQKLNLPLKPPRPPSPACLLTTTPLDENPTLLPLTKSENLPESIEQIEEYDPFDTSIAKQFGKTELRVLETELLVTKPEAVNVSPCDDFDPRAEELTRKEKKEDTSTDTIFDTKLTEEQPLPPLSPLKPVDTTYHDNTADDPFDTSVANRLGQSELSFFEIGLSAVSQPKTQHSVNANCEKSTVESHCIFASEPLDGNPSLQPDSHKASQASVVEEDFDPFDTSIAEKLGKSELKVLEETILNKGDNSKPIIEETETLKNINQTQKSVDDILSTSPTESATIVLQPLPKSESNCEEEIDPFDTSIANQFGETELKVLETELLRKSPVCDEDFDPRK